MPSNEPSHTNPTPAATTPGAQLKAHEHAATRDWPGYFKAVEGKGPRETLLKALELFEKENLPESQRTAIDLGCGSGRDTFELLRRGWRVLATDSSQVGLDLLSSKVPDVQRDRLETRLVGFEELTIPPATLVNASYSLPFCDPAAFPHVWQSIVRAIPLGGRFAGQFFGDRDEWAPLPDRSHHTRIDMIDLFDDFLIDQLQEVENREAGATGLVKDWHIFHVVARKCGT